MPLLHPPMNFAAVEPNIYRSAYPTIHNIAFLHSLGIRTVALLSIEPLPPAVLHALTLVHTREAKNNTLHGPSPPADRHPHTPTTDHATRIRVVEAATFSSWLTDSTNGGDDFSQSDVQWAMDLAVNAHWHPILFACPTGELQTSVVIGCLRRYQSWSLTSIFGECELFTNYSRQLRSTVMQFIEAWRPSEHPISETDLIYRHSVWVAKQRQSRTSKPSHHQPHPPHTNHAMSSSSDEEGIVEGEEDQNEEDLFQIGEATPDKLATAAMNAMAEQQHWPAHDTQRSSGDGRAQAAMQESVVDGPPLPHHRERPHSSGSHPTKRRIIVAEWYTQAIRTRKELELLKDPLPCGSTPAAQLPAPHERYAAVRNPPALDERSTFMKESIVEEDDD